MLKPIKPKRMSDLVFEQLRDLVFKGRLKPGDRLMTERELAENLGVSRPTVREAINKMVALQLLEHRQGQGTFVNSPELSAARNPLALLMGQDVSLVDLLEVRLGLECNAVMMAARRATGEDIQDLGKSLADMAEETKTGGLGTNADVRFHMGIAYATRNIVQIHIMKNFFDLLIHGIKENLQRLYEVPGYQEVVAGHHSAIFEAVRNHDPDAGYEAMKVHITFVIDFLNHQDISPV